jgi:hypothetical protein
MGAETTGRKLGIGMRLFARAVQQGATAATAASRSSQTANSSNAAQSNYPPTPAYAPPIAPNQIKNKAGGIARGAKRFGEAVWGPLAHTGGVLFLEITGLFFALFAAYFGQAAYKSRYAYRLESGQFHFVFLSWLTAFAALTLLFTFFTLSAFVKAYLKEKKNRARRRASAR